MCIELRLVLVAKAVFHPSAELADTLEEGNWSAENIKPPASSPSASRIADSLPRELLDDWLRTLEKRCQAFSTVLSSENPRFPAHETFPSR
jgi:hypothetical protein